MLYPQSFDYIPIIKDKKNDLRALGAVVGVTSARIKPLIEMSPIPNQKLTHQHFYRFGEMIMQYYPFGKVFIDLYGLLPNATVDTGENAAAYGFNLLSKYFHRKFTPAFGIARDDKVWEHLSLITQNLNQGFAFRVDSECLDDKVEDTWAEIIERSAQLKLNLNEVDIIIDLRDLSLKEIAEWQELALDFLSSKPSSMSFRSISLVGSSALRGVTEIEEQGFADIQRKELQLWAKLHFDLQPNFELKYGDYGVIHPEFVKGGSASNANAKFRYTVANKIRYYRGTRVFKPTCNFGQYANLARKLVNDDLFQGRSFSKGDRYINDCAQGSWLPTQLGDIVFIDMNHHITYCLRQITTLQKAIQASSSASEVEKKLVTI